MSTVGFKLVIVELPKSKTLKATVKIASLPMTLVVAVRVAVPLTATVAELRSTVQVGGGTTVTSKLEFGPGQSPPQAL